MIGTDILALPIVRYRFDCVAQTPIRLPDHPASLLRGAFGRALRQVACITREKDCTPCALKAGAPTRRCSPPAGRYSRTRCCTTAKSPRPT